MTSWNIRLLLAGIVLFCLGIRFTLDMSYFLSEPSLEGLAVLGPLFIAIGIMLVIAFSMALRKDMNKGEASRTLLEVFLDLFR